MKNFCAAILSDRVKQFSLNHIYISLYHFVFLFLHVVWFVYTGHEYDRKHNKQYFTRVSSWNTYDISICVTLFVSDGLRACFTLRSIFDVTKKKSFAYMLPILSISVSLSCPRTLFSPFFIHFVIINRDFFSLIMERSRVNMVSYRSTNDKKIREL